MRRFMRLGLISALALLVPTPGAAQERLFFGYHGYTTTDTASLAVVDMNLIINEEDLTGVVPELAVQYELFEDFAVGVNWGIAYSSPEGLDSAVRLGNFTAFAKQRFCGDDKALCMGWHLDVSLAPSGIEDDAERYATGLGLFTHLRYNRFGRELLSFSPALTMSGQSGGQILVGYISPEFFFPFTTDDVRDSMEAVLSFGILYGIELEKWFFAALGYRLSKPMTFPDNDGSNSLDLFFQFPSGRIAPTLGMTVSFDEPLVFFIDIVVSVGVVVWL